MGCLTDTDETYATPRPQIPPKHSSISQLVAEWEQDPGGRAALEEGRQWVARTFYGEDGDTVPSLGLPQASFLYLIRWG